MGHETSIRLPARLRGVVRTDPAAEAPVAAPVVAGRVDVPPASATAAPHAPAIEAAQERERVERVLTHLTQAVAGLQGRHQQFLKEMEKATVELAVAVAARFLHEKVSAGDFPFEGLIRQAVQRLETRQAATAAVHPDDLALLRKRLGENHPLLANADLRLVSDPALKRGDCKVESQDRSVHVDLDGGLAALRQQLLQAVAASTGPPSPK